MKMEWMNSHNGFSVGDRVRCIVGLDNQDAKSCGGKWDNNNPFTIRTITLDDGYIYWPEEFNKRRQRLKGVLSKYVKHEVTIPDELFEI